MQLRRQLRRMRSMPRILWVIMSLIRIELQTIKTYISSRPSTVPISATNGLRPSIRIFHLLIPRTTGNTSCTSGRPFMAVVMPMWQICGPLRVATRTAITRTSTACMNTCPRSCAPIAEGLPSSTQIKSIIWWPISAIPRTALPVKDSRSITCCLRRSTVTTPMIRRASRPKPATTIWAMI